MEFRFINQKNALPQSETVNLADLKCNFALSTAELIKPQLHPSAAIEKQRPLFCFHTKEREMRQNFAQRGVIGRKRVFKRGRYCAALLSAPEILQYGLPCLIF